MILMLAGVFFTSLAVAAQAQSSSDRDTENLWLGVFCSLLSICSAAINMVIAGLLGTNMKLNSLDATCYLAVPAMLFLLVPSFLLPHSVPWPGVGKATDAQVILRVW